MHRLKDVEVRSPGITPRAHIMRKNLLTGRRKYPFKAMIIGDYFVLESSRDAQPVRNSLSTFYKKMLKQHKTRLFTVRPNDQGVWICRRIG